MSLPHPGPRGGARPRALVAAPDLPLVLRLAAALRRSGYDVQTATCGRQAVACLSLCLRHAGRLPDALVLGADLPFYDGVAIVRTLRRGSERVPAIVLAGADDDPHRRGGPDLAGIEVVHDPVAEADLHRALLGLGLPGLYASGPYDQESLLEEALTG